MQLGIAQSMRFSYVLLKEATMDYYDRLRDDQSRSACYSTMHSNRPTSGGHLNRCQSDSHTGSYADLKARGYSNFEIVRNSLFAIFIGFAAAALLIAIAR